MLFLKIDYQDGIGRWTWKW